MDSRAPRDQPSENSCERFGAGVLLHVGYHKTGTTWLQRTVFPRAAGAFSMPWRPAAVARIFVGPHEFEWNARSVRAQIEPELEAARRDGLRLVVSSEELSGNPHSGGHGAPDYARRLHEALPGARVLVVVRRQPDMLVSVYRQYVSRGGVLSPARYFAPPPEWFRYRRFRLGNWEYDALLRVYLERFGHDRVKVLPYEMLVADPARYVAEITRFAEARPVEAAGGKRENAGRSALAVALQRCTNRLAHRDDVNETAPLHWPIVARGITRLDRLALRHFAGPWERRLRQRVEALCAGCFEASNARLAAMTGLDLARWGYAVG